SLHARTPNDNWAFHESSVAYGEWEWKLQYYGSGSASITFIGLNKNYTNNAKTPQGYKLIFQIGQRLAINRLDSSSSEVELNSTHFVPVARAVYNVKIIRTPNNQTFRVYVNDALMLNATDSTYTTSEVLELSWSNIQELDWIKVTDSIEENSWGDFFTGLPSADSDNVFTKIALYIPFITLGLVILLYILRLLFSDGSWTRSVMPLILALFIGLGYGLLVDFVRDYFPYITPDVNTDPSDTGPTATETTNGTSTGTPPNTTDTSPNPSETNSSNAPTGAFTGVPPRVISNILLGVSGVFITIAVVFIGIDFFRKRDDEFHERILDKERRWMPTASTTDHRKRVIRAYHKASYDLIDHGAKSERSMTPGEFESTTTGRFEIKDKSLEDLTGLYEEARFSEHELSEKESTKSWLIVFFISIIFIFIIIFRDLRRYTRKIKHWARRSYLKTLPRISLTYQHFGRRGDLLTLTSQSMCKSIHYDMLVLLKIGKGISDDEIEQLLQNKKQMLTVLPNENVVLFLCDLNTWIKTTLPQPKFFDRFFAFFRNLFKDDIHIDEKFFIELATVIYDFRKLMETGT
ncbi:MAG: DUF4129 domain-containing protein, partial [Candidatus Heimdallarchaeota archaeon]